MMEEIAKLQTKATTELLSKYIDAEGSAHQDSDSDDELLETIKREIGADRVPLLGIKLRENNIKIDTYRVSNGCVFETPETVQPGGIGPKSGDGTVPYLSLSFCKNWVGTPGMDVKIEEMEKIDHREILKMEPFWTLLVDYLCIAWKLPPTYEDKEYALQYRNQKKKKYLQEIRLKFIREGILVLHSKDDADCVFYSYGSVVQVAIINDKILQIRFKKDSDKTVEKQYTLETPSLAENLWHVANEISQRCQDMVHALASQLEREKSECLVTIPEESAKGRTPQLAGSKKKRNKVKMNAAVSEPILSLADTAKTSARPSISPPNPTVISPQLREISSRHDPSHLAPHLFVQVGIIANENVAKCVHPPSRITRRISLKKGVPTPDVSSSLESPDTIDTDTVELNFMIFHHCLCDTASFEELGEVLKE